MKLELTFMKSQENRLVNEMKLGGDLPPFFMEKTYLTRLFDKITCVFLSTIEISRKTKEKRAFIRIYYFFKKKLKIRGISVALSN
jgi:hypothetical protein